MDHAARIEAVKQKLVDADWDALIVTGPHNSFYLSGFHGTGGSNYPVMIVPQEGDPILYVSPLDEEVAQRDAAVDVTVPEDTFTDAVTEVLPADADAAVTSTMHIGFYHGLGNLSLHIDDGLLTDLRQRKDTDEIARIRAAYQNTEAALTAVQEQVEPGKTERELAAVLEHEMRRNGADGRAFPTIVASNAFSSLPHHEASDTEIGDGPLLFDVGAVVDGYRSDISRIMHIGEPSQTFVEVYETVREAQQQAAEQLRAGTTIADVDAAARTVIDEAGYGDDFIHSTGHGVGIEVHEAPNISPNTDGELAAGMVVTIEPGIYLHGKFGVRIEDAYHVTDDGADRLTTLTRDLQQL